MLEPDLAWQLQLCDATTADDMSYTSGHMIHFRQDVSPIRKDSRLTVLRASIQSLLCVV
jgi:hypothetical protein